MAMSLFAEKSASPSCADASAVGLALLDRWQHDFPLTERPFLEIGAELGQSEGKIIAQYEALQSAGLISRIGAIIAPNTVGASTLAAVAAAPAEVDRIAQLINEEPGVNHNYEREHAVNLWFVIAAADQMALDATLVRLSHRLERPVRDLRLEQPYHLDLGFPISGTNSGAEKRTFEPADITRLIPTDMPLLSALADGLRIVPRPFALLGARVGKAEAHVIDRLMILIEAQIVRRFGIILKHRPLGFTANAMVVFDVDENEADRAGERLAGMSGVTLCYRRRRAFDWPYNLYCMVHARSRLEAEPIIADLRGETDAVRRDMAVLFSRRCFRQRGVRFGVGEPSRREVGCERAVS